MRYEPKSSLQDINDYGHFMNRGAWMTASGYGRKFLSDLQHCEACLREREAEVTKLKEMLRLECVDSCCTDDDVRAEAKKVLSPALVDGDSHAIPDITEIVCILVKEIERLKTILDIADH